MSAALTWTAEGASVDEVEAALRELLHRAHEQDEHVVPARVLNMIAFVDQKRSTEVMTRLRHVGRYSASRLLILALRPDLDELRARLQIAPETGAPQQDADETALVREVVRIELGDRHLPDIQTIAAPLVVTDLPTLLWSPHGHRAETEPLLALAQSVLVDSVDDHDAAAGLAQAIELAGEAYVVDLAWLRSTPWRERLAGAFDRRRDELTRISSVQVRHHPDSTAAAALALGWLASRLGWREGRLQCSDSGFGGSVRCGERSIELTMTPDPELRVRGLAGVAIETTSGWRLALDRGPGGLRARRSERDGTARSWTIPGASRGESGVLGEGIRQALLRDPTYLPALLAAKAMLS